jgi:predicted unusual protein kinase regulating ubiquinone biosynthesis (AarF/ABC1/UbiB family)
LFSSSSQAASTDQIVSDDEKASSNGNGSAHTNGNGNGNGAQGLGGGVSLINGSTSDSILLQEDPCSNGQLEACAAETLAERESAAAAAAAATNESSKGAATIEPASTTTSTPYAEPGGRWSKFKSYSTIQRTLEIWTFAIQLFFKLWLVNQKWTYGKQGMTEAAVSAKKTELATWLKDGLVRLGPTFIKIGQQFSTRVDVLSPEFIKQLEMLQDNVPPFSSEAAMATIEKGLGKPVLEIFEEFDPQPIAAASLGQVHVAKVDGQRVVVKVQRPGLKELFDIDLKNIRVLAQWLQKVDPKSDGAARDWVAIYDECSRILYQEIDYTLEGANADRFRKNFQNIDWIKVPEVLWKYSNSEVLTMEYTPGIKINKVEELDRLGVDRELLAKRSVESYLQQLLTYGFFHADPHPGNLGVQVGENGDAKIIYYDFGMMGTIPTDVRSGLLELFYGVYEKDSDRCLDALITMGVLVPGGDRTAVRRTAEFFLKSFQDRLDAQRAERKALGNKYSEGFKPQLSKDEKKAKRKEILSAIGEDLLVASADKPFRFPATFTFVVRSFTVLDGIGKGLDPRFDISEISAPYARELVLEGRSKYTKLQSELRKASDRQNRAVKNLFKGPNMIEDTHSTIRQLERGDLKLRVRSLEAERALSRVALMQKAMLAGVLASMLVNVGTVLSVSAIHTAATFSFVGAAVCGLLTVVNLFKVKLAEKKEAQLTGVAA